MKRLLRIILISLVGFLIIIQFIPNELPESTSENQQDLFNVEQVPNNIRLSLTKACYDCHSNQTVYPWYSYIAPMSWLVAKDTRVGREKLNFSEWGNQKKRSKIKSLSEIAEEIENGNMPFPAYLIIHQDAKLNKNDKENLIKWTDQMTNQIMGG